MSGSSKKEERYSPEKVERLKNMISRTGREYMITIDEMRVVQRTKDISQFDVFEEYVDEDTESVKIQLFHGTSNMCDTFIFYLRDLPPVISKPAPVAVLGSVEVDAKIAEKLEAERMKWDAQLLREKLQKCEADLKEAEDHIDKITTQLEAEREKAASKAIWNELSSTMLSIVKTNPAVLSGVPGLGALAGAVPIVQQPLPSVDTEASFSRKSETSEEDEQYLLFLKSLQTSFNAEEFTEVMTILGKLAEDPSLIPSVKGLL